MHNTKCIFTLMQHAGWTSNKHPFLLCSCNKGDGVTNNKHICTLISDEEQLILYQKSKQYWSSNKSEKCNKETHLKDTEKHRKWVSKFNRDVLHFGLHPTLLLLSVIQIDDLHMGCLVGKHLILRLRIFSKWKEHAFEIKLFNILKTIWSNRALCLWRLGKLFLHLLELEIKAFVLKYPKIATLLRTKGNGLKQIEEVITFVTALDVWYKIKKNLKKAEVKKKQ